MESIKTCAVIGLALLGIMYVSGYVVFSLCRKISEKA